MSDWPKTVDGKLMCKPMDPDEEGWSEWVHPLPGYLFQCCDCDLIHEMQFQIAEPMPGEQTLNEGEGSDGVVIFRARRHKEATND